MVERRKQRLAKSRTGRKGARARAEKDTQAEQEPRRLGPIDPDAIYRPRDAPKVFGFKHSQLYHLINKGIIPRPVKLAAGGQAVGWYGRTIIKYQQEREAAAMAEAAAQ